MASTSIPFAQLNYSDYLLATQQFPTTTPVAPPKHNKFLAVFSNVARVAGAVAGNIFMPGFGGAAMSRVLGGNGYGFGGNGLGGNGLGSNLLAGGVAGANPMEYLQLQEKMTAESRMYEAASAVMKSKHDAAMDCLRNIAH